MNDDVVMASGYESTARSIWPSIYPAILELVQEHRSTIVFVNNRRLAERLAVRLNELAEEEIARAHHGSLAREQRVLIEEDLKAGRIPCLVATCSLELGIDMGAVDLVIQVECPKSVARGLQRVGRAGHELGSTSKGRIFPKFRADLLESAVVARAMRGGEIEETRIPRNPLDVLAQQIVAIVADEEIEVAALHKLVRGAYPFSDLSLQQLENVLDMLAGRYPSDEFAELRPRIVWDRTAGVIRGRAGARRLAVTNAGTIPDRGLFGVYLVDGGGRVGELDEEMVYEARQGQTFLLGASTWRIEEITRDRVHRLAGARRPRRRAVLEGRGRRPAVRAGREDRTRLARAVARSDESALGHLRDEYHLDPRAAQNLLTFLREQADATGVVPTDRTIVVERFRDEIGDWRVCILTPFGGRVHAPWAMAMTARLRDSLGLDAQSIWSDDGIALHLPEADAPPSLADLLIGPDEIEELVVGELGQTALFGARFRENAARALLIPRRRPGQRTPLWQQRLKAQNLLQVARQYGSFPIMLETYRECLQDVFDLPALKNILRGLQTRELDLVEVETASASPFASSLLFDYVATYMYEDDTPPAERRAQALSLDRDLLRELLGQEELRELLDPDALAEVERQLAGDPRDPDELHDVLRRRGDLRAGEYDEGLAAILVAERRALTVRIAGEERLIAAEDAGRYRDALGVMPPGGLPDAFLDGGPDSLRQLVLRFAKGRGPFTTAEADERFGLDLERAARTSSSAKTCSSAASCGPAAPSASGAIPTCCAASAARRSPRCGARSSPSSRPRSAASCPPGTGSGGARRCARRSCRCRGSRSRSRSGRARCCRAACPATSPRGSTRSAPPARSSGSAPASTASPSTSVRTRPCSAVRPARRSPRPPRHDAIRAALGRGAMFWFDLLDETALEAEAALPALWDLVWAGEVTNDAWTPLRAGRRYEVPRAQRRPRRFSRTRGAAITSTQGRWSPTDRLFPGSPDRRALAELLLERQGIVTRDGVRGEGIPGGYSAVYARAAGARDDRRLPARLLRRGPRRCAVRARRRGRAAARAAGRRRSPSRSCSPPPIRRSRTARRCRGRSAPAPAPPASPARRSSCSAARRRSSSSAAAGRWCRCASPTTSGSRPAIAALVEHVRAGGGEATRRRALRRRAGHRDGRDAAARRGRLPRRAAPRGAPALDARASPTLAPRRSAHGLAVALGAVATVGSAAKDDDELLRRRSLAARARPRAPRAPPSRSRSGRADRASVRSAVATASATGVSVPR